MLRGRYNPFNLTAFNRRLDHGLLLGLADNDHTQYVNAVSDTSSINLTLNGQSVSGVVTPGGVDHGSLAGLGGDDHPQYIKDSEFTQDSGFLVGTGAGTFQEETGATLRTSIGVGTGDSPVWTGATLSGLTQGSVLFAGASGVISQDNDKLFWDDTNKRLGIGISTPASLLHLSASTRPTLTISQPGVTAQARIFQVDANADSRIDISTNAFHNGSAFVRDDTSEPSSLYTFGAGGGLRLRVTNAGGGNISWTEGFFVDFDGKFGVGTISPQRPFHVFSGTLDVGIRLESSDARAKFEVGDDSVTMGHVWFGAASGGAVMTATDGGDINLFVDEVTGNVGIGGETDPETLVEMTGTAPYLTLHNSTHEDSDGGRESRLNFKGEQSGGEETTLARIEAGHDGTGDDQLGRIVDYVNTGAGLVEARRLDSSLNASFAKIRLTAIGGYAVKLTNKTGSNTVAGQTVRADNDVATGTDDAVILTAADEFETIGVFLDSGIADGSEAWVVVFGIADVAMEDNTAATRGNWVRTSVTEAGYADATNAAPPGGGIPEIDQHLHEIGHCIESVAAGGGSTHILARCLIHFN